jgi:radical SAM protein (TIGR01212 family)
VAGSGASHIEETLGVRRQVQHQVALSEKRHGRSRYIAYLQAFTNTYGPLDRLRAVYEAAVSHPDVAVLSVGTRAACVDRPVCELLAELNRRVQVWLELGLQSVNQATLDRVNRAETPDDFRQACRAARACGLRVVAHLIVGLPGDTPEDCLRAVDLLNAEGVWGVKIHNLYIDSRAPMAAEWEAGAIATMTQEEYVACVCDMLESLRPQTVIHRLTGQAPRAFHLAPSWALSKGTVLEAIEPELKRTTAARQPANATILPLRRPAAPAPAPVGDQPILGLPAGVAFHYARCCHPVPGDPIVGLVRTGKGVSIHRTECAWLARAGDLRERALDIGWNDRVAAPRAVARLNLVALDKPGSLGTISTVIGSHQGNIADLRITRRASELAEMFVDVEVSGLDHLHRILAALRATSVVTSVERASH